MFNQVLQHEVKLSQQAESIMLIRKEACDTKLATNKLVEDTLNECKVTVTGAATRAASALEQEIEKARAAESEMGEWLCGGRLAELAIFACICINVF